MLTNVEEALEKAQREFKRAQASALKLTDNLSPKDAAFKKHYERAFADLPETLEALEEELSNLTTRADCLAGGRTMVLEEYEKTLKNIKELEKVVDNRDERLQKLKDKMEEKREEWLPQVKDLLHRINENFDKFFKLMGCVGEVSLEEPPERNDYSKYGICIKVQFRESSSLQQLGPHTQSGGERAVSTALYMLSLQELTTVPFRCVDEINQGMDEFNERIVFKLLVSTVEKANAAQCFLLTPKVLSGLDYSDNVKVLCILSGNSSFSHTDMHKNKFIQALHNRCLSKNKRKHSDSSD